METCQRCGKKTIALIMSVYNTQMICLQCKDEEERRPDHAAAVKAENEAVLRGDRYFEGIGLSDPKKIVSAEDISDREYGMAKSEATLRALTKSLLKQYGVKDLEELERIYNVRVDDQMIVSGRELLPFLQRLLLENPNIHEDHNGDVSNDREE